MLHRFAFISRHTPTQVQFELAAQYHIELVHVGDTDAFTVTPEWVAEKGDFNGVVVVHPAAALRLVPHYIVGVFENSNRAPEGAPPQFEAKRLELWLKGLRGKDDLRFREIDPVLLKALKGIDSRLARAYLAEEGITEEYLEELLLVD